MLCYLLDVRCFICVNITSSPASCNRECCASRGLGRLIHDVAIVMKRNKTAIWTIVSEDIRHSAGNAKCRCIWQHWAGPFQRCKTGDYYGALPHRSECAHAVAAAYQILLDTSVPSLSSHFLWLKTLRRPVLPAVKRQVFLLRSVKCGWDHFKKTNSKGGLFAHLVFLFIIQDAFSA